MICTEIGDQKNAEKTGYRNQENLTILQIFNWIFVSFQKKKTFL